MDLGSWVDLGILVESAATVAALAVGGYWTYRTFIRERLSHTKIAVEIRVDELDLEEDGRILHAHVNLENCGKTKFSGKSAELRIRQILPVSAEIRELVRTNTSITDADKAEVEWPCIAQHHWPWEVGELEIEPGEKDTLHADFGILPDVEVVELYFYASNRQKMGQSIGWTATEIYRFNKRKEDNVEPE